MKPEFSEFTYGYTLIEELSKTFRFKSVPRFPSLWEEGKVGGYDASIDIAGLPLFIQFKRSDYLSRKNAKHYRLFKSTYYRFHLHALKHSKQHNLLLHLEKSGNYVFYVAPIFHEHSALQKHYFASSIAQKSIWVSPTEIGKLPDNEEHTVCFNKSLKSVYFCSEPKEIKLKVRLDSEGLVPYFENTIKDEERQKYQENKWGVLYEKMLEICANHPHPFLIQKIIQDTQDAHIIQRIAHISRIVFGCDLLIYKKS